jgi:proteic killer suppression protein
MIQSFRNKATEDIFNGKSSKPARKIYPQKIWSVAHRKLDQLDSVTSIDELRVPPGNRLEVLSEDRKGQYRIRLDEQYWICFIWCDNGPEDVEIIDYH